MQLRCSQTLLNVRHSSFRGSSVDSLGEPLPRFDCQPPRERTRRAGRRRKLLRVNTLSSANTRAARAASPGFEVGGNSCLFRFTSGDELRRIYRREDSQAFGELSRANDPTLLCTNFQPPIINVLLRHLLYTRFVGSQVRVDEPIKLVVYARA